MKNNPNEPIYDEDGEINYPEENYPKNKTIEPKTLNKNQTTLPKFNKQDPKTPRQTTVEEFFGK